MHFSNRNQHFLSHSPGLRQLVKERGRLIVEVWSRSGGNTQAKQREFISISQRMEDTLIGVGSVPVNILLQVCMAWRPAWSALQYSILCTCIYSYDDTALHWGLVVVHFSAQCTNEIRGSLTRC